LYPQYCILKIGNDLLQRLRMAAEKCGKKT
jgi:hypothetical protein